MGEQTVTRTTTATKTTTSSKHRVLTLFGTRPEVIKLAPVIRALEARPDRFAAVNVSSSQHTDLLHPLVRSFGLGLHHDLQVMQPNQTLSSLSARVLSALDPVLLAERPDVVMVQGDTTTALAGAMAAFHRGIPVGHVEAGLRSGDPTSPFPEEMNRRLITRVASWHFAATSDNRANLLAEGVPASRVFVTGNTVVDGLLAVLDGAVASAETAELLGKTQGQRRILLTTHRRESFGETMSGNLQVLRRFVAEHEDVCLIFPTHPNPSVSGPAREILGGLPRVHLVPPMAYEQFVVTMSRAWLIVSDSGGVQEEAPTLGKPLLVLRANTERPEAVAAGCARLVGRPELLAAALDEAGRPDSWTHGVKAIRNPFGDGTAAAQIVAALAGELERSRAGLVA